MKVSNCPICDAKAEYVSHHQGGYTYHAVYCTSHECYIELVDSKVYTTKDELITKWNNLHNILRTRLNENTSVPLST